MQPSDEQLAVLSRTDRFWLRLALWFAGPLKWVSELIVSTYGAALLWFTGGRRFRHHGLDKLEAYDRDTSLVMAANHRSFFDFYTITYTTIRFSQMTRRCFFPVRSTFFYEGPIGAGINFGLTGMAMFPPIMRDKKKAVFNRWALDRMAWELSRPGTLIGMHPEGKRNKSSDPWSFLKPQPGIGHLAMKVDGLCILPVYVKGMTNRAVREWWRNWTCPERWPIDIRFGDPVCFDDLIDHNDPNGSAHAIAERCMEAIEELGEQQRAWERATQRSAWPARPLAQGAPAQVLRRLRAGLR